MKKDMFIEVTPKSYECGVGACPAVFSNSNADEFVIIGKSCEAKELPKEIGLRVGDGETAVVVPAGMIKGLDK